MKDPSTSETNQSRMFPRRDFLRTGALGTAGAVATLTIDPAEALATGIPREQVSALMAQAATATPEAIAAYTPLALTSSELEIVRAIVGRIIPTDDLGPGADEAGVHIYIDQVLAGPDAASLSLYQAGLAAIDSAAGADGFASAEPQIQDDILRSVETGGGGEATPVADGQSDGTPTDQEAGIVGRQGVRADVPEAFFPTLLEHTRQGMFGDPVYGGNANFVGWNLIGYPGIKLVWSEEEQDIGTDVEPEHTSVEEYGGTGYEQPDAGN